MRELWGWGVGVVLGLGLAPVGAMPVRWGGDLYLDGVPGSRVQVAYDLALVRGPMADGCGRVVIRNSAVNPTRTWEFVQVEGQNLSIASLPLDTLSRCINGVAEVNPPHHFRLPDGSIVLVGFVPLSQPDVRLPKYQLHLFRVNACGFVRIPAPEGRSFNEGGVLYRVLGNRLAGMPLDGIEIRLPPLCRNGVRYVPGGSRG